MIPERFAAAIMRMEPLMEQLTASDPIRVDRDGLSGVPRQGVYVFLRTAGHSTSGALTTFSNGSGSTARLAQDGIRSCLQRSPSSFYWRRLGSSLI